LDNTVTIDVLGQPFSFKTDSDVSEARAVAEYVSEQVSAVHDQCSGQVPTPDKRAILILAALNITSELFNMRKKHDGLMEDINQRSAQLLNTLDTQQPLADSHASR